MLISKSKRRRRCGSAILEAAFVMAPLCWLTFGCIEFGDFFYVKHTLEGAAREGARAAATGASYSEVTDAVAHVMGSAGFNNYTVVTSSVTGSNPASLVLTPITTITATTPTAGTAIEVQVECTWGTVGIRPMGFMPASKLVIGSTTMRREG